MRGVGQDDVDGGIFHHEVKAILRAGEVERKVGAIGLEDSEKGDDQLKRAAEVNGDEGIGLDAELAQSSGELVGARVQLVIGP